MPDGFMAGPFVEKQLYYFNTQFRTSSLTMKIRRVAALFIAALPALAACFPFVPALAQAPVDARQFRDDIAFIRDAIAHTHPDPTFSADPTAIEAALNAAAQTAPASMSRDQAWQRLAALNAVFADAHLFVGYPDWRAESKSHLASGGTLFPYEVDLDPDGTLLIRARLGGGETPLKGARILAIDGIAASTAVAVLSKRVHGDTPLFRARLLAQRWWLYHWKMYGTGTHYRLTLERGGDQWKENAPASAETPAILRDDGAFDRQFGFTSEPGCAAVLTAGSFDHAFKERFLALTQAAFAQIREDGTSMLFIDISANGGGDDDLWLDGLMPYLATQPYRTGSAYVKKVIEPNPARGETVGQVVEGAIDTWRAPQTDKPLHFKGKVVVILGPATYSSAVLFANVMHDFQFATLTGTGNAARRTQSGGIRRFILPHSGLALWVPRFVLAPPGGGKRDALLAPDVALDRLPIPACASQLAARAGFSTARTTK
jgi:hypothetical protein